MLTSRGWWLLGVSTLLTLLGALLSRRQGDGLAIIGITILTWFLVEWALFAYQAFFVLPRLRISREIRDERKAVPLLWANGEFDIVVKVQLDRGRLPDVFLEDAVPFVVTKIGESEQKFTAISKFHPGVIEYRVRCEAPGELIFEGVRVRLTDRQGFFYKRIVLKEGRHYPVLPRLSGAEGNRRGSKRHNIFPPPGLHRLRQPGGGSELQDLRDYLPGDPPKMIAWKPSARKDKLITKEFETEVPVRATLFVDASESVRVGPIAKSKLTRLANLAAGVAEGVAVDRDHVGLTIFDENGSQMMRPNRSRTHLIDMLHLLAKAAARSTPLGPFADADALSKLAFPVANDLYPELMDKRVNSLSFDPSAVTILLTQFVLAPLGTLLGFLLTLAGTPPQYVFLVSLFLTGVITVQTVKLMGSMFWNPISDTRRIWIVFLLLFPMTFIVVGLIVSCAGLLQRTVTPILIYWAVVGPFVKNLGIWATLTLAAIPMVAALMFWAIHGATGFFGEGRQRRIRRKQLGLLFATLDGDEPEAEVHYLHDDQIFARRAMRFLADHQTRYPIRLHDIRGRYLFYSKPKLAMLASAVNYGVSRGRDNELFVILADLVDLAEEIGPVMESVRVAIGRHHQVMIIIPWQEDMPLPSADSGGEDSLQIRRAELVTDRGFAALDRELERDQVERYHKNFLRLRKEFGRLGVTVVRAGHDETVQMVLDRMNRLRGMRVRR
ncbi:DUF58 domain-containing protein [Zavarzinella formosa]|uniref:DUF58 domain-containing protein n=1 Tax=Zavarzinella formosa TaxID=360055 RepID=UPI0002F5C95C|nr:DUF58 domain-containing protein [Zavarzinella formosa]